MMIIFFPTIAFIYTMENPGRETEINGENDREGERNGWLNNRDRVSLS
jgi:hypothetical protein